MTAFFDFLYRFFLMPYLERDKYFNELVNDVFENDIPEILKQIKNES